MIHRPTSQAWYSFERWSNKSSGEAARLQTRTLTHRIAGRLPAEAQRSLSEMMAGKLILPSDPLYDSARVVFNPRFDAFPAAIAQCAVETDVWACLDVARRFSIPFRLRSGGHCFAGFSTGSDLVVDVSRLNDIRIDGSALTATVGAGSTMGVLRQVLNARGFDLPLGGGAGVCVAGFMQGGGWSATSRTTGMNCDHVLTIRMMLADGRVVLATEHDHRDLWWAARGGTGGNFGVLLSVTYRLSRINAQPTFTFLGWPLADEIGRRHATTALMTMQDSYIKNADAPRLTPQAFFLFSHDQIPWLIVQGAFIGSETEAADALAPLHMVPGVHTDFDPSTFGLEGPMPRFDRASRYVAREVAPAEWDSLVAYFVAAPASSYSMCIELYGGAIAAYPANRSSFSHRKAAFNTYLDVFWETECEHEIAIAYQQGWLKLMEPLWNGYIYQNFPSQEAPDYRHNYWGNDFFQLLRVKLKYDPHGLFEFPQAIVEPAPVEIVGGQRCRNDD